MRFKIVDASLALSLSFISLSSPCWAAAASAAEEERPVGPLSPAGAAAEETPEERAEQERAAQEQAVQERAEAERIKAEAKISGGAAAATYHVPVKPQELADQALINFVAGEHQKMADIDRQLQTASPEEAQELIQRKQDIERALEDERLQRAGALPFNQRIKNTEEGIARFRRNGGEAMAASLEENLLLDQFHKASALREQAQHSADPLLQLSSPEAEDNYFTVGQKAFRSMVEILRRRAAQEGPEGERAEWEASLQKTITNLLKFDVRATEHFLKRAFQKQEELILGAVENDGDVEAAQAEGATLVLEAQQHLQAAREAAQAVSSQASADGGLD